jgi:hypothetical protein
LIPPKKKTVEEHLETIEMLLAGLLLKNEIPVKRISKVMGMRDTNITNVYPQNKEREKIKYKVNNNG